MSLSVTNGLASLTQYLVRLLPGFRDRYTLKLLRNYPEAVDVRLALRHPGRYVGRTVTLKGFFLTRFTNDEEGGEANNDTVVEWSAPLNETNRRYCEQNYRCFLVPDGGRDMYWKTCKPEYRMPPHIRIEDYRLFWYLMQEHPGKKMFGGRFFFIFPIAIAGRLMQSETSDILLDNIRECWFVADDVTSTWEEDLHRDFNAEP